MSERSASQESAGAAGSGSEIELQVNGESLRVAAPCSVAKLLEAVDLGGKRVAVAVNREVILRGQYATATLESGDRVEILEAVGGG